jgi:long-chain acyl-CoA synthetase
MKVVRGKVETKYKDRIELLYTPDGKNIHNETNIESILQLLEV